MRTPDSRQPKLFYYFTLESRIPAKHPLRAMRKMVNECLADLDEQISKAYSPIGRPSIVPERLLRAMLLQLLYSIRSERALVEHIEFNILYRWFVGLELDEPVWEHSSFTKNRNRLLDSEMALSFLGAVLKKADQEGLLSRDHFSVDGTLLEAWASLKSFKPKDNPDPPDAGKNPEVDFHGQKRSNATHASTTDPQARLAKKGKGKEAKLCYGGHVVTENRNGLVVNACVTLATGSCETQAALEMLDQLASKSGRITAGADKAYDNKKFVQGCRSRNIVPHVAQKKKGSAIDGRTTRHEGYAISQRKRKRIEEVFGWKKTIGCLRKLRVRGVEKVKALFVFASAAYNLVRMRSLQMA